MTYTIDCQIRKVRVVVGYWVLGGDDSRKGAKAQRAVGVGCWLVTQSFTVLGTEFHGVFVVDVVGWYSLLLFFVVVRV